MVNLLQPGANFPGTLPDKLQSTGLPVSAFSIEKFLTHLIPTSIADAMAQNEILQIVVFAVFFSVALGAIQAIREADRAEAEAWSIRMEGYGGPAQPSPTIVQCLNGGLGGLEVECNRCKARASLPLYLRYRGENVQEGKPWEPV
jgi:hypothetical protein